MSSSHINDLHAALDILDTKLYTQRHDVKKIGVYYNMGEGKDGIERLEKIAPDQVDKSREIQYYHYFPHHLISPDLTFKDYNNDKELQKSIFMSACKTTKKIN